MRNRQTVGTIGFDLGLRTSQRAGPRADDGLPAIMITSFYRTVVSRTMPRSKTAHGADSVGRR
ncbi:MAG: hypothetical protein H0W83_09755 [Planctomycetes bacterium]|nr:hypothetical protein [Planctomycetota bacterium]